ncbi:hypothetical protein MBAV_000155 [Candidatus Magnetobacterium bavaricum]|uniref:Uncharacterized protein n=1 Tax=Candidatus Magnetobacterium bavaricum TaxID=29290 RepID=A0A0F3H0M3_9BACT|nr:hypothetical protein MBAV_000155 [Candidatus Magnetobacterium bavaricum]
MPKTIPEELPPEEELPLENPPDGGDIEPPPEGEGAPPEDEGLEAAPVPEAGPEVGQLQQVIATQQQMIQAMQLMMEKMQSNEAMFSVVASAVAKDNPDVQQALDDAGPPKPPPSYEDSMGHLSSYHDDETMGHLENAHNHITNRAAEQALNRLFPYIADMRHAINQFGLKSNHGIDMDAIGAEPEFDEHLNGMDEASGRSRADMLAEHAAKGNMGGMADMFNAYQKTKKAPVDPLSKEPLKVEATRISVAPNTAGVSGKGTGKPTDEELAEARKHIGTSPEANKRFNDLAARRLRH